MSREPILRGSDPEAATSVGRQIHALRTRAGISQADLAERAGMSTRALRDIENGRVRRPQSRTINRLAAALGLAEAVVSEIHAATQRDSGGLRYLILGNLSIQRGDETVVIARPMLRRLLGLLTLRHPEPVTPGEVVEVLWTPEPPKSWQSLIHTYVSQIRQLLGAADDATPVVGRVPSGYLLNAERGQSDLGRFDELTARAGRARDAGRPEAAMEEFAAALRCWRDQILADADSSLRLHPAAIAAGERRIKAALSYADLALRLRRPEQAVPTLWDLTTAEPLHEGLHARLILTLASCGEQAAALNVFQSFRERLDEQLGITPSEEIRDAYMRVLRQQLPVGPRAEGRPADPPAPARPAQLPAAPSGYVSRARLARELDAALTPGRSAGAQAMVVVGAPGSGKTALAVHWAHARREVFPDGQLFVNLRGHSMQPPLSPVDVLGRFLRALGTPPGQVPSIEEEAAALYRTLVANKRMLIVLDNARSVAQVRPLLPGGDSCRVVITSRVRLAGLVARDGARYLLVDELHQAEAEALLRQILGAERVAAESDAAATLVRLCGMLPLALRVAAANLIAHPVGIAAYCAQLAGGGLLSGLHIEGDDRSIRSTFDLSYQTLSGSAQRMFRLLSLMPGADVAADGAAVLAGTDPAAAAQLLRTLTDSHIVQESAPGRFTMHDLLRSYARELAGEAESASGQRRLLDWYAATAEAAARALYPGELTGSPTAAGPFDPAPASTWLEQERENLVNATLLAEQAGLHRTAWRLAGALHGFLSRGMYIADTLPVATAGLSAATADGDLRAMSAARLCLAECHWARGHNAQARDLYATALTTAEVAGWRDGQAVALRRIAAAHQESGDMRQASELLSRARDLTVERHGTAAAEDSTNLGLICWKMGRLAEAVAHHEQAAACFAALRSDGGEAIARTNLGIAYRALGRPRDAIRILTDVLPVHARAGNRTSEIVALSCLSSAYSDVGDHATGLRIAREALRGVAETHDRRLEANALYSLAAAQAGAGDLDGAVDSYRRSLDHAGVVHDRFPQASALIGLAMVQLRRYDATEALAAADMAVKLAREAELPVLEGNALNVLACIRVRLGQPGLAVPEATTALALHRRTGHRPGEARSRLALGAAHSALDRRTEAFGHLRASLLLCREMGAPPFGC